MTDNKLEATALPLSDDELDKVAGGIKDKYDSNCLIECIDSCPICGYTIKIYVDKTFISPEAFAKKKESDIRQSIGEHINSQHPNQYAEWLQSNPL